MSTSVSTPRRLRTSSARPRRCWATCRSRRWSTMADMERRKRIREQVEWLRAHANETSLDDDGVALPFLTWAELIAYEVELARAEGFDEGEIIEVLLTASSLTREDLLEAEAVLKSLGFRVI